MWTILAFISALCLGFYDISKKIALRNNRVIDVLTLSVCFSSMILFVPLMLSRFMPEMMIATPFYVPQMDWQGHLYTILKSGIVLSSWICAYVSLKHLPISVVSPMQATRPMWTLVGALLIFGERLSPWQWTGVCLAIGTIFLYSFSSRTDIIRQRTTGEGKYYFFLIMAILIGAGSGLYDKYLMRHYDHNAVQVYYTLYQAAMMLIVWGIMNRKKWLRGEAMPNVRHIGMIAMISVFLVISDNVYMLALQDPDSLIAVVSTIRRGGAVIGFAYGLLFLKEKDPIRKILCMIGICAGLVCLAIG